MGEFVVSARKYRPQRFDEVVGQEHITQTLKNALKGGQLAHAFLFCGPRGVGKTTCARILARVINCEQPSDDYEACQTCSSCKTFNQNASFNVTELDAASNNSVEHIRALIEQVRFQPQHGRYKVFIIDEVHMLSQQAFNAFLKTLEEPPPYAIFILATTEKHKILPTILSRCQIYDFRRIQVPQMVAHLSHICKEEGITAEKEALHVIAQKADGALRDSLSIFDRVASFSDKKITFAQVIDNLNVLDYDYYFQITEGLLSENISDILLSFDEILRKGFDPDIFINGLAAHFRDLLVCKEIQSAQLLEASDDLKSRYLDQAKLCPKHWLLSLISMANDCDIHYKMAKNNRLHVELALVKMAHVNQAITVALTDTPIPEKKKPKQVVAPKTTPLPQEKSIPSDPESKQEKPTETKPPEVKTTLKKSEKFAVTNLASAAALEERMAQQLKAVQKEENKPVVLEEAIAIWQTYLKQLQSPSAKIAFEKAVITQPEETVLHIAVPTGIAKNMILDETDLLPFLRQQLSNKKLSFEVRIQADLAEEDTAPKPKKNLTNKEKYLKMLEQNPLLQEMRQRFDLDTDHS